MYVLLPSFCGSLIASPISLKYSWILASYSLISAFLAAINLLSFGNLKATYETSTLKLFISIFVLGMYLSTATVKLCSKKKTLSFK